MEDTDHLERELCKQKKHEDIFLTKYPEDETITNIILDFDGADNKDEVYKEVLTIHNFLKYKGINSIIVSSTNKGFHFYIQIPPMRFDEETLQLDRAERNRIFVMFTENIIHQTHFHFQSLDPTNTNAGLGGNIRLLGSIHPKTGERVHIVKGEFINTENPSERDNYYSKSQHYVQTMYKSSIKQYEVKQKIKESKILENKKRLLDKNWKDPIKENDLRELIPQMYGGTVKKYHGYIFMQCPWHTDRKPSLKVTKEWFYCTGCGKKGNIWALIKNGELKLWNTQ